MYGNEDIFEATDFSDFRRNFLFEKNLDNSPNLRVGELSKILSKTNIDVANKLNSWASQVANKISRYANKLNKKNDAKVVVRTIPVGDSKTEAAAIIIVKIETIGEIQVSIFDSNRIAIELPQKVADVTNKGRNRKFLASKDKAADYLIATLERILA